MRTLSPPTHHIRIAPALQQPLQYSPPADDRSQRVGRREKQPIRVVQVEVGRDDEESAERGGRRDFQYTSFPHSRLR